MSVNAIDLIAPALERVDNFVLMQRLVVSFARELTDADGATFILKDGPNCFYVDEDAIAPLWAGKRFPQTECIGGWAMLHAESVCIEDIREDPRIPQAAYRPTFVRSLLMVPINASAPIGAIGCYWAKEGEASRDTLPVLEALADRAAEAIDRLGIDSAPTSPSFGPTLDG